MIIMSIRLRDAFGTYRGEGKLYCPEEIQYWGDYSFGQELRDIFTPVVHALMQTRNPAMPWQLDIEVYDAPSPGPAGRIHDADTSERGSLDC